MKKKLPLFVMMALLMASSSSLVMADDQVQQDIKTIEFTGAEKSSGSDERVILSRELPEGLYITTGEIKSSCCPNTDKLIKAIFTARGFKLADHLSGSSMAIEFDFDGYINMGKVEEQATRVPVLTTSSSAIHIGAGADPSAQISTRVNAAGQIIESTVTGDRVTRGRGAANLISSFLPSDPHARDFAVEITSHIHPKPELGKDILGNDIVKETPDSRVNHTNVYYYSPNVGYKFIPPETMITILVTAVNQWIDRYMVLNTDASSVKSSSIQAAPTTAEMFKDCPDCPDMVVIPAGSFEMGANQVNNEKPVHQITFDKPFALGKFEVTQGQWKAVMGDNPSKFSKCGDYCPVEKVSWDDAKEFIQKLNAKTGKHYRLPSEAEWEYACRAGGKQEYCGSDNVDSVSWNYENNIAVHGRTHPVSTKQANAWGLFDMSGNVGEWVEDGYHDNYNGAPTDGSAWSGDGAKRVYRGGEWNGNPPRLRAASREKEMPAYRANSIGFRLARMLP